MKTEEKGMLWRRPKLKSTVDRGIDAKYIDVLDGTRALSVILVLIFHFWQQTWIFPTIKTPFLSFIGLNQIDFTPVARVGYLFVDMMVLLSGFLLFLPLMRHIVMGESMASWKNYARRRVARIVPSYLFAVLVLFFLVALPNKLYTNAENAMHDLITHLTFTQTLSVKTYLGTKLDAVLWTVAVEVWFYILFPFIATLIKSGKRIGGSKARSIAFICIAFIFVSFHAVSILWEREFVLKPGNYVAMYINQLPAFLGTYANGMLASLVFVMIAKYCKRSCWLSAIGTAVSILSIVYIVSMIKECAALALDKAQLWQVSERARLTAAFSVFILSTALAARWYRFIFSNRLMRFLAGISYNLYIWHQWLAVQLKSVWRIPYWTGDTPPNQLGDRVWMNKYAIIITLAAFIAAVLATYLIEKPFANLIMGKTMFLKRGNKEKNAKKA